MSKDNIGETDHGYEEGLPDQKEGWKENFIQKNIDNGNIDTDPICNTDLFAKLKWDIGSIMFQHLAMNKDKTAIEANPATHRIAKYVYGLLSSTPLQPVKDEGAVELMSKSIRYLALELPEPVWKDVAAKWQAVLNHLSSPPEPSSKEQEGDAVGFAEWIEERYTRVHSDELKKSAWVNCMENKVLLHGSDYHYTTLINEVGKTTEQLYQLYKSQP